MRRVPFQKRIGVSFCTQTAHIEMKIPLMYNTTQKKKGKRIMKKRYPVILIAAAAAAAVLASCGPQSAPPQDAVTPTEGIAVETPTEAPADGQTDPSPTDVPAEAEATPAPAEVSTVPEGIYEVKIPAAVSIPENEAMEFVRDIKAGWNLGNAFDASNCNWLSDPMEYESAWCGAKTRKELILKVKEAGFNAIRIPVSWHNHVNGSLQIDEKWISRVQEVADWAYDEGMYVIINIHHDNEDGFEYPSYAKMDQSERYIKAIWEQIADRFADYDEHLIFETMNEPRQVGTDHEWWINDTGSDVAKECFECVNRLNQVAVDTIRSNGKGYNTSRYIMVPGYCASPEFALVSDFKLPDDSKASAENRIILSVHAYTPYSFALDMSGTSEFDIAKKKGTADIDSFMRRLYSTYVSKGIPVIIGEYGALEKNNNTSSREQFAAYYVAMARHYGLSTFWWDNNAHNASGECFQIIDRSTLEWRYQGIVDQIMYYCE